MRGSLETRREGVGRVAVVVVSDFVLIVDRRFQSMKARVIRADNLAVESIGVSALNAMHRHPRLAGTAKAYSRIDRGAKRGPRDHYLRPRFLAPGQVDLHRRAVQVRRSVPAR